MRVDYTEILWSYFGFLVLSRFLLAAKKDTHMKKQPTAGFRSQGILCICPPVETPDPPNDGASKQVAI